MFIKNNYQADNFNSTFKTEPVYSEKSFLYSRLFAGLAVGLGIGAIAEVAKKSLKPQQQGDERRILFYWFNSGLEWLLDIERGEGMKISITSK